jgi:hypothetical protein
MRSPNEKLNEDREVEVEEFASRMKPDPIYGANTGDEL